MFCLLILWVPFTYNLPWSGSILTASYNFLFSPHYIIIGLIFDTKFLEAIPHPEFPGSSSVLVSLMNMHAISELVRHDWWQCMPCSLPVTSYYIRVSLLWHVHLFAFLDISSLVIFCPILENNFFLHTAVPREKRPGRTEEVLIRIAVAEFPSWLSG